MNHSRTKWAALVLTLTVMLIVSACGKKPVATPPPPPPPPPSPSASLSANPTTIQAGQQTTLTWSTQNATDVSIDGIGSVQPSGSQAVSPTGSTTYRLVAKGPGGTQEATARVTVTSAPPPPPPQASLTEEQAFSQNVKDIFFDYDKYDLRPEDSATIQASAAWLKQHPNVRFTVEGHCDERGSTEYNLALGDNRANAARQALVSAGVPADRIRTISYGKEKPFCTESTEQCWQQNRRDHFVFGK